MADKALTGVKVLEFTGFVTGPYCTKLLADLGAGVIKIEKPGLGDPARNRGPFPEDQPHPERSGLFLYLNTNKSGVTLDTGSRTGRRLFLELVHRADILVEDTPPGTMEEMGLGYDRLREENPGLIMTSITPFGQTGPYRDYRAYGLNVAHGSGSGYLTPVSPPEGDLGPVKAGGFFDEYCNGLSAAAATMVAYYGRLMTGQGEHIDISEQEASIAYDRVEIGMFMSENFISRRVRPSSGATLALCRDGQIILAATGNPRHWDALVAIMGNPDWTKDDRYKDEEGRFKHAEELNAHIARWTIDFPKEELYHQFARAGIPVGVVRTQGDLMERDGQLRARGFFCEIEHPEAGRLRYPSAPYLLSETPWRLDRPSPTLGQHNEVVYGGLLGYANEELVRLRQLGVI
jgi:CoA:oxalate CoA-transferase